MKKLLVFVLVISSFTTFARTFDNFLIVVNSTEVHNLTGKMKEAGFVLSKVVDVQGDTGAYARCPCDDYQLEFKKHQGFDQKVEIKKVKVTLEQGYMTDDGKPRVTVEN